MREHFPIDADPGIPNAQYNVALSGLGRQPDPAAWLRILGRIVQEVLQHLLQATWISDHGDRLPREGDLKLVTTLLNRRAHGLDRTGHALREIQWFLAQLDLAMFDAGDLQQTVDQTADALRLAFHQAPNGLPQGGILPLKCKHLKSVADRSQRGAQLMPQLGEELVHVAVGLAQFSIGPGITIRILTSFAPAQNWTRH